jgi:hypothetical protein
VGDTDVATSVTRVVGCNVGMNVGAAVVGAKVDSAMGLLVEAKDVGMIVGALMGMIGWDGDNEGNIVVGDTEVM